MKRLVLFVEGEGDRVAAPILVDRLLNELNARDVVFCDPRPFRVGGIHGITGRKAGKLNQFLEASCKRHDLGGVLLLLDGEKDQGVGAASFCARNVARSLVTEAREVGAGSLFSLACVFAQQEYESWLLAGIESLAGRPLPPDKRPGVRQDAVPPAGDLGNAPRDAKGAISRLMIGGYNAPRDQAILTRLVDLNQIRSRNLRSFVRLENALRQLVDAQRSGNHIATPG